MIKPFQEALNKALVADSKAKQEIAQMVLEVDLQIKESMYGFHENKKSQFLALPRFIGTGKRLLESGESSHPFNSFSYQANESNIDFQIRLNILSNISLLYNMIRFV